MSRAEYVRRVKNYLTGFGMGEVRLYDEYKEGFPWRSLASIASRMGKTYGMIFKFKTHKNGKRTITRLI